jgi:hypothetical protein
MATLRLRLILKQVVGDCLSPVGRFVFVVPKRLIPGDGATGDQGSQNRPTPELRRWRLADLSAVEERILRARRLCVFMHTEEWACSMEPRVRLSI